MPESTTAVNIATDFGPDVEFATGASATAAVSSLTATADDDAEWHAPAVHPDTNSGEAFAVAAPSLPKPSREEYPCLTSAGDVAYTIVRIVGADGRKTFITQPAGIPSEARILYRLPELHDGDAPVVIVEGERKVDALWRLGVTATCNPHGAGKWLPQYNRYLQGRAVIVWPDNDEAGRRHANDVCRQLVGIAAEVRVVKNPVWLKAEGDVMDVLARRGGHV